MQSPRVEVHGHRGSRGTHPENTPVAFEEAFLSGADAFELDTQWTKDEVAIVFHDFEFTSRVCRLPGTTTSPTLKLPLLVRNTTWKEACEWDIGSVPQSKYPHQSLSPQTILTLDQTLEWLAKKPSPFSVDIEIKAEPQWPDTLIEKYTARVLENISNHAMLDRCLVMSFDFRPLQIARRALPLLKLSCLFDTEKDFVTEAKVIGANVIGPHFSLVDEDLIRRAHEANLKVIPWTVNEQADWARLIAWKVDGLITDYPRDLVTHLGRRARQ